MQTERRPVTVIIGSLAFVLALAALAYVVYTLLRPRPADPTPPAPTPTGQPLATVTVSHPRATSTPAAATRQPQATLTTLAQTATSVPVLPLSTAEPRRLYWGAWLNGPPDAAAFAPGGHIQTFELEVAKGLAIIHWGLGWKRHDEYQAFPTEFFNNIRAHGSIPLLDWGAWVAGASPEQPEFRLSAIATGAHDDFIRQWAADAQAWGHPFFLRFNWEMNGDWKYPWSAQLNGNTAADYVAAWQHVHDLFTAAGANNATWVWCPNIADPTTVPLEALYPGDAYVDWTCLDGFNVYPDWLSFDTLFTATGINWLLDSNAAMQALAPTKPMLLVTGTNEAGDGGAQKAEWITDAFTRQLPNAFPNVDAVIWFNWDGDDEAYATLPIESSTASVAAFAAAVQSENYAANTFGNLDQAPIAPLP